MRSVVMLSSMMISLGGGLLLLFLLEGSDALVRAGAFAAFCSLSSLTSYMVLSRAAVKLRTAAQTAQRLGVEEAAPVTDLAFRIGFVQTLEEAQSIQVRGLSRRTTLALLTSGPVRMSSAAIDKIQWSGPDQDAPVATVATEARSFLVCYRPLGRSTISRIAPGAALERLGLPHLAQSAMS